MDLSPGMRTRPRMLRAGRTMTVERSAMNFKYNEKFDPGLDLLCSCTTRSFREDFLRDLPQRHMEFEHRGFRTASPAPYFPMCPDKLHVGPRRQIEQQRHLFTVELLRKRNDRLEIPGRAVG